MHNDSEVHNLLAQIDDLYDASAQLPTSNEHWAERSRMQVEIIQLCRELADMHDDAPLPYWLEENAEEAAGTATAGDEEASDGGDGVMQKVDDVARVATLPMYAYQAASTGDPERLPNAADAIDAEPGALDPASATGTLGRSEVLEDTAAWYASTAAAAQVPGAHNMLSHFDGPMLPPRGA